MNRLTGDVCINGISVVKPLTKAEVALVECLIGRESVTRHELIDRLYADAEDRPHSRIIDVRICHIRTKLKPHPCIVNVGKDFGWRLVEPVEVVPSHTARILTDDGVRLIMRLLDRVEDRYPILVETIRQNLLPV